MHKNSTICLCAFVCACPMYIYRISKNTENVALINQTFSTKICVLQIYILCKEWYYSTIFSTKVLIGDKK